MFKQTEPKNMYASKMFVYFSQLLERPVIDRDREGVGRIYDIVIKPDEVYPQSSSLIIRKGFPNRKYAVISWSDIEELDNNEVVLKIAKANVNFSEKHDDREELTLRRDILDQQVIDSSSHKIIRVNDIHLLIVNHAFMVAHVDISTRGLVRRLGFESFVDYFVRLFNKNSAYISLEHLIPWKYIHPLSINPSSMTIKVNAPHKQFNSIPAADLGEIFLDLNINHQIALFKSLELSTKARIFINIDFKTQKLLIEELSDKEVIEILNAIPSDEATDFLEKLPKNKTERLLGLMENKHSKKLSQLLGYANDSAGGLMTTDYLVFSKDTLIESVLKQIKERVFKVEPAQYVYIVDEANRLVGSTNFRRLMLAEPQNTLEKAAFPKTYFVHLDSSVKEVAYLMEKYKYYTIAVVDESSILQGIITVDDILNRVISIAWRRLKRIKIA